MKRLRSINWFYLIGTLPFVIAISWLSVLLANQTWQKILAIIIGAAVTFWLIKKFRYLPRKAKDYGEMIPLALELPVEVNVNLYLCPEMDRYLFLKRSVEVISPLIKRPQELFQVAVSPKLLEEEGEPFVKIAVMRELIRYRQASQVKATMGLVTPILLIIAIVEAYYGLGFSKSYPIAPGYANFFGPILITVIVISFLLLWNRTISKIDYKVDDELKRYFSREEIISYIECWDKRMLPDEPELINEKSRELELYYIRKRVERL